MSVTKDSGPGLNAAYQDGSVRRVIALGSEEALGVAGTSAFSRAWCKALHCFIIIIWVFLFVQKDTEAVGLRCISEVNEVRADDRFRPKIYRVTSNYTNVNPLQRIRISRYARHARQSRVPASRNETK